LRLGLKDKHLVMKFADGIWDGEREIIHVLLHGGNHWGRSANKDFAISGIRVLKVFLDMVFSDEANATFPARWGVIEDEVDLEAITVEANKLFYIVLEEDIFLVDVGIDETNGGCVGRVAEDSADDLDHRGNTCASGNHAEMVAEIRVIDEIALGTLYAKSIANLQACKDTRDVAFLISLDEEIKAAKVVVTANGCIATRHDLAVDFCRDRDMLANGKTENVVGPGKLEAVEGCIGGNLNFLLEGEFLPFFGIENLGLASLTDEVGGTGKNKGRRNKCGGCYDLNKVGLTNDRKGNSTESIKKSRHDGW